MSGPLDLRPRILFVDDDPDMRTLARMILHRSGFEVLEAIDVADALRAMDNFSRWRPDVVILDNVLPGGDGLSLAARILAGWPDQNIVMFTAHLTDDFARRAARIGVSQSISKTEVPALGEIMHAIIPDARFT